MRTRTRTQTPESEAFNEFYEELPGLSEITDDDIEEYLYEQELLEQQQKTPSFWNLPTVAGLSLIFFGGAYLMQKLGLFPIGPDLTQWAVLLPWLAGILIILLGFGILSWKPKKRTAPDLNARREARRKAREKRVTRDDLKSSIAADIKVKVETKKRLRKSRTDRKIAGVCGGIAEYLNLDPTIVRIAFVIAAFAGQGMGLLVYLGLAFFMPDTPKSEIVNERTVRIIRD